MYLLDTNVISNMQKPIPNEGVVEFLKNIPAGKLFISSVTLAELSYGIYRLDTGSKQTGLLQNLATLRAAFAGRILPYSEEAAVRYGELLATQEKRGFNDDVFDSMLIAQALVMAMSIVTRNETHFVGRGVTVINPYR